jgi:sulfate permease, SulP family
MTDAACVQVDRTRFGSIGRGAASDAVVALVFSTTYFAQALAYSRLALAPAFAGVIVAVAGAVLYPIVGSSVRMTFGPSLGVCALVGATLAGIPPVHRATSLAALTLMVAVFQLLAGWFDVAFLERLFPESVRVGYLAGTGVTIVIGQVAELASSGRMSLALGLASIALVLASRRLGLGVLAPFAVIALASGASVAFCFSRRGVPVIGDALGELGRPLSAGLDAPALPSLLAPAFAIACYSQVDAFAGSERFARHGELAIRSRRACLALGTVNLVAGLFGGFAAGCGTPSAPPGTRAGRCGRRVMVLAGALLVVTALSTRDVLRSLPLATLAGLVVVAAVDLIDARRLRRLCELHGSDYRMALVTAFGVAITGPRWGVGIGVAAALFEAFRRAMAPERQVLAVAGGRQFRAFDPESLPVIDGVLVYRFGATLFFCNVHVFLNDMRRVTEAADRSLTTLIVTPDTLGVPDAAARRALATAVALLRTRGIRLAYGEGRTAAGAIPSLLSRGSRRRYRWVLASWPPRGRAPRRGRAARA